jgi:molybdopterin molybdotransferase
MALTPWRALAAEIAGLGAPLAGSERVTLGAAAGRILAEPVLALQPLPLETHAVMDGYALGSPPPGRYRLLAGKPTRLSPDEAAAIAAGEAAPEGAAAVALAARATVEGDSLAVPEARRQDNLRRAGEEAAEGAAILAAFTRLDARHLALAAAVGVHDLALRRRPRVALLALQDQAQPLPHLPVLAALLGGPALAATPPLAIRAASLTDALGRAAQSSDLVVVAAESLEAEDGALAIAIRACGGTFRIGRAALKPAKPIVIGRIGAALVLGFAGTAYAAAVAAHLFLRPLLRRMAGLPEDEPLKTAVADFAREREPGRAEALPALWRLEAEGPRLALAGRFGQLSALAALDGFALVEAEARDIAPGDPLLYHPLGMPLL